MVKSGVKPDEITFINVLSACVHGGKVEEGERIFNWMMKKKKMMKVEMEHYGCMVDLYGRAGELEKAENLIKGMPFEADVVVWGAFLRGAPCTLALSVGRLQQNEYTNYKQIIQLYRRGRGRRLKCKCKCWVLDKLKKGDQSILPKNKRLVAGLVELYFIISNSLTIFNLFKFLADVHRWIYIDNIMSNFATN